MQIRTLGIAIIVLGILMTVYSGFNYMTSEKVVEVGKFQINKETNHSIPWSPWIGVVFLIGGSIILLKGRKI